MSQSCQREVDGRWFAVTSSALLVAAALTRLHRFAAWGLAGDELATLRDSLKPELWGPKELLFWMNHLLVQPFLPLDELGLRLLPVVFGIVGMAVLVLVGRRLLGSRAALLAGVLLLFNPWHLAYSQMGRYYTLVFLLAVASGTALYLGVVERNGRWIAAGVAATVLAALAHPTGALPAIGFLAWFAAHAARRTSGRRRAWLLGGVAAAGVAGIVLAFPLLSQWSGLEQEWGIGGLQVGLSYAVRLGAGTALAAAAGVALLWIDERRELARFLAAAVVVPLVLIAVLGLGVAVHTGFLFATAPFALLAAGAFLERVISVFEGAWRRGVVGAALAGLVVAPGVPTFVSHYVDGSRPDFRGAARHVAERAGPNDVVLTDQKDAFRLYAPGLDARPLIREPRHLQAILDSVRRASPPGALWVVPEVRSLGGFGLQGFAEIEEWVRPRCELSVELEAIRIDHQRNRVPVWRCPGSESR